MYVPAPRQGRRLDSVLVAREPPGGAGAEDVLSPPHAADLPGRLVAPGLHLLHLGLRCVFALCLARVVGCVGKAHTNKLHSHHHPATPPAIGFVFGAFLGLIAQGLYLYYIFLLVKSPQPPPDPTLAKRQKVRPACAGETDYLHV